MSVSKEQEIDPSTSLCIECGLCCDGSIFSHAELNEDDCKRLGISYHNEARLSFPCQHLSAKSCTIYQQRPAICASYQCKTLAAMKAGEIGFPEAQDIIRKAAKLGSEFEQSIPPGMTRKQAIICVAKDQCPQEASNAEFLKMRLTYVALQTIVDRYMRGEDKRVVRSAMRGN